MKKLISSVRNLSFRKKTAVICLIIGLIPVIFLGTYSYTQMRGLLIERENTALKELMQQKAKDLDYKIDSYLAVMGLIVWNEGIRSSLTRTYENNFEMYLAYRDVIDPAFQAIRTLNKTIEAVTIYTDTPIYPHGDILRPLSDIAGAPWYDSARNTKPFFTLSEDGHSLLLISRIYYQYSPYTSIVCMRIDAGSIFDSLAGLFEESYGVMLINESGDVVYQYADFADSSFDYALTAGELKSDAVSAFDPADYVIKKTTLSSVAWDAYLYRPIKIVSAPANKIAWGVIWIVVICFAIVLLACIVLSRIVVRPLEVLTQNMSMIEQGDLSITIKQGSSDEIGRLIQAFSHMMDRLKHLINEVLKSRIAQQEYEMKALQAQINPHFLYNSLSLINGKAILAGQTDISRTVLLLSTFYRTTLNKGSNMISVRDELENTRSYAEIQRIMHSNSFDIVFDVDEDAYSYTMPNLLLQPLVENAILHGIDHKEASDRGVLTVSCRMAGQKLVFKVLDNGCGIPAGQCENILSSISSGYGIQNVHQRIQLYYGQEYGLHYTSTAGAGTCVTLTLSAVHGHGQSGNL